VIDFLENSCAWEVPSSAGGELHFNFVYFIALESLDGVAMTDVAIDAYRAQGVALADVYDEGPEGVGALGDEANYFYSSDISDGRPGFVLAARADNVLVMLKLDDVTEQGNGSLGEWTGEDFLGEARETANHALEVLVALSPDDPG
jgi:hypothetical protein